MTKLWRLFCWNFEIWAVQKYENLVDLENPEKNDYLVAIVAVDTAENGPPKVWPNWINYSVVSLAVEQIWAACNTGSKTVSSEGKLAKQR